MRKYYAFFFISGFCCVLYELVWLRLAMAQFGVTTPLVSIVLSLFMAGLGLGAWGAGAWIRTRGARVQFPRLRLYAAAELLIGLSAVIVPSELRWGHEWLLRLGISFSLSSSIWYYLLAGGCLLATLGPWCACMGATFPLGMFAISGEQSADAPRSFSYLYLANVLGATTGAVVPLLVIELVGFSGTLRVGALLNVALAAWVLVLSRSRTPLVTRAVEPRDSRVPPVRIERGLITRWLLFATGLTSLGMEVLWIRAFTPYVGTVVYSFASVLALYLFATYLGTRLYRIRDARGKSHGRGVWLMLALGGLVPLLTADPTVHLDLGFLRLVFGVAPFAVAAGYATPMLVDHDSQGDPARAASAYAINVLGCIVGPLLCGFVLLPSLGERLAFVVLTLPWFVCSFVLDGPARAAPAHSTRLRRFLAPLTAVVVAGVLLFTTRGYEGRYAHAEVLRDHTATVIAYGAGIHRHLLVNGVGITAMTPITKMMVHLPMALLGTPPRNVLVMCFGMGTTHRSALSWGVHSTAVELLPSVPKFFSFFHADGAQLLLSPLSRVVIDDGRRYLEWSNEQYDIITLDPPPPVEAAGSSLLYSVEFYAQIKRHLAPSGILQQWLPGGDTATTTAVARALRESFPHVRVFHSVEGWGVHLLASMQEIPRASASDLAGRMPPSAIADLLEWGPETTAARQFDRVLRAELPIEQLIAAAPGTPALHDDRPINEYYLLRRLLQPAGAINPDLAPGR